MKIIKQLIDIKQINGEFLLTTNCEPIKLLFMTDDIIRIRTGFDGDSNNKFEEESYCLMTTAWEDRMDNMFKGVRTRIKPKSATLTEEANKVILQGTTLKVVINKNPFQISVFDQEGTCLYADVAGIAYQQDSNNRRFHYSEIEMDDCFYGFGEKSGKINKIRKAMKMSPKDAMGYDPEETDGLYKHIPFYIKLGRKHKKAVGLFYHNTYECVFDMGKEKSNYWHYYSKYATDGGDIDLFLINGPTIKDIVSRYTDLTGKSALLPMYALGYLGSSMYYPELEENCDDAIVDFVDTNKEEEIPIDGFQLSSGYTVQKNNKRCTFTWNYKRFKDPVDFFHQMESRGVTVTPNVKPGMLLEHPLFDEMKEKGMFLTDSTGEDIGTGYWWGGQGAFVDFTNEEVRSMWKEYLTDSVISKGTTSIWNDNCEYDSLVDKDCICHYEGKKGTIGQLKALMSNLMCYTTDQAIKAATENVRPYIVCRSGYSGIQQYAQTWAGDNYTSWETLKFNIATVLGMSVSGVANQGCDIGGFYGPAPDADLFVRWVQNGIFQPRFSIHSTNSDNTVTEPWMYPEVTHHLRNAIKLRYQMIPYFYSLMAEANHTGAPIMRPMFYEFQNDERCYDEGVDFMLGESLLVANVVEKGATTRKVYLPEGSTFYDYYTRERYTGGQEIEFPVDLSSIPMFVRSGAIIPFARNEVTNLHKDRVTTLGLLMEASVDNKFELYEDDGISFNYKNGDYLKTTIDMKAGERVVIKFTKEGNFNSSVTNMFLDLICREKGPYWVSINGKKIEHFLHHPKFEKANEGWLYNHSLKSVQIKYPEIKGDVEVIVSFEQFDLIGM